MGDLKPPALVNNASRNESCELLKKGQLLYLKQSRAVVCKKSLAKLRNRKLRKKKGSWLAF